MAKEAIVGTVETGITERLQPWQALFSVLAYAIGVYGLENEKALILYGLILTALGFVQVSTYKHKEAIKEIVAPWLVEQLLATLSDYLGLPDPPSADNPTVIVPDVEVTTSAKELKARLTAQIAALEAVKKNGASDSGGDA